MNEVDTLYNAILKQEPHVTLKTIRPLDALLEAVYARDPRLTGWVNGCSYTYTRTIIKTLEIDLNYEEGLPARPDDIILDDDNSWRLRDAIGRPEDPREHFWFSLKDSDDFLTRLNQENEYLGTVFPGYAGYEYTLQEKTKHSNYQLMHLTVRYLYDLPTLKMYYVQAQRQMENIVKRNFGDASVPKLIKTFLAFSYLQQHCEYDDQAFECIKNGQPDQIERPWVTLPFGPISKNMGICCGIAHAMQMFLNHFGVPNQIINGETGEGEDYKRHAWNLVKFDNKYYHIDATYGVSGSGVYVGSFMKTDADMRLTHSWDAAKFPVADGKRFDYDFVEAYIEDHEDDLRDVGVEDTYMFPADITE